VYAIAEDNASDSKSSHYPTDSSEVSSQGLGMATAEFFSFLQAFKRDVHWFFLLCFIVLTEGMASLTSFHCKLHLIF